MERLTLTISISFYVSYIIFVFYPIVGPRFYLQEIYYLPIIGPYITPLAERIVQKAGLYGGAMPSSHCAVALAAVAIVAAEFRRLRFVSICLLILLCLSTVYGRYHYFSDVAAGLVLGWLSLVMGNRWQSKYGDAFDREEVKSPVADTEFSDIKTGADID